MKKGNWDQMNESMQEQEIRQEETEGQPTEQPVIRSKKKQIAFCAVLAVVFIGTVGAFVAVGQGNKNTLGSGIKSESEASGNTDEKKETKKDESEEKAVVKDTEVVKKNSEDEEAVKARSDSVSMDKDAIAKTEQGASTPALTQASKKETTSKVAESTPQTTVSNTTDTSAKISEEKKESGIPGKTQSGTKTETPTLTPTQTPAAHTHNWVVQTVHHEAETRQVYVVDQAAYDEPLYESQPVYEVYGVDICNVCGADCTGQIGVHSDSHVDWETFTNPFSYHYEERKIPTGEYQQVQVGTIHHEETGHYETQVVKAAYDEIVGYKCLCGATK